MATQAQKDAAAKRRKEAEAKKNAAQLILRTGKNKDGSTASAAQRAAAIKRRDAHIATMRSSEDVMEATTTKALTETRDLAATSRSDAMSELKYALAIHGKDSDEYKKAFKDVKAAEKAMTAQETVFGKDGKDLTYDELKQARDTLEASTVGKSGPALFDIHTKMRAYGDRMREIEGRQKGQGTSYVGPGLRVALDADGKIQRDDQGRVVYDVDPEAYSKRFIPKFTPTAEQIAMGEKLFPGVGITEGLLTPWQQTNIQWMTGSKSDKLGLLDDMGIEATENNLNLFGDTLKEGRIPKSWRDAWRTEQWGDVKDPDTGLWTPATGQVRQDAIREQLERYSKGYFNPTTGKPGSLSNWGPNTGTISPNDFVPPGWKPGGAVPELGIKGALSSHVLDDGGKNTIGLQDWTRFGTNPAAPPPLQEGGLKHYQIYAGAPTGTGVNLIDSGSNNIWGDSLGTGSILSNVAVDGKNSATSKTHTDTSGNKWVMTPSGNWVSANSDYGKGLLGTGRLHGDPNFYDSSGAYVGAEGIQGDGTNSPGFSQAEIATGVAVDYGGKWGDRQMGLNMLGKMGMFGDSFGAAKSGTGFGGDIETGYNDPDIEHSGVTGAGSGGWT